MGILKKVFGGIKKVVKGIGKGIKKIGKIFGGGFNKIFGKLFGKLGPLGSFAMMFLMPGLGGFFSNVMGKAGQLISQIPGVGKAFNYVMKGMAKVSGGMKRVFGSVTEAIGGFLNTATNGKWGDFTGWISDKVNEGRKAFGLETSEGYKARQAGLSREEFRYKKTYLDKAIQEGVGSDQIQALRDNLYKPLEGFEQKDFDLWKEKGALDQATLGSVRPVLEEVTVDATKIGESLLSPTKVSDTARTSLEAGREAAVAAGDMEQVAAIDAELATYNKGTDLYSKPELYMDTEDSFVDKSKDWLKEQAVGGVKQKGRELLGLADEAVQNVYQSSFSLPDFLTGGLYATATPELYGDVTDQYMTQHMKFLDAGKYTINPQDDGEG